MTRRRGPAVLAAIAVVAGMAWGPTNVKATSEDPRSEPIPVVDYTMSEKSLVTKVRFDSRTAVEAPSVDVTFGRARSHLGAPPLMRVSTADDEGAQLQRFNAWHPAWVFIQKPDGHEARIIRFPAEGTLISAFEPELSTMTITDVALGEQVASIDLQPAVAAFCTEHPNDPDCTTDLSITKTDAPDPVAAGEELTYTLLVSNDGTNPAQSPRVTDTLPDGVTFQRSSAPCTESPTRTLTCDLERLAAGGTQSFTVTVLVDADLVHRSGGPVTIRNGAAVTNLAGSDTDPSDNAASTETRVVARADLAVTDVDATEVPPDVLVGDPEQVTIRTGFTNLGPSSPMDVVVESGAEAEPGMTVSPAAASVDEAALAKGESRTWDQAYTVECQRPGLHTVTFRSSIRPARADDEDPNPSNNAGEVSIELDCVVPVALNIKPGSFPNSINPDHDGVNPMAVLSTAAGEYGLPFAFDARTIDATSVRFGLRSAVRTGGGTIEPHGKGHVEDSYELDEKTRDRDPDMLLHMNNRPTPLHAGDTEACVKGTFVDASGNRLRFLGCDSVSTVPR